MITTNDASVIIDLIEIATESNWPSTAEEMLDRGYSAEEVTDATKRLCDIVGRSPIIEVCDF